MTLYKTNVAVSCMRTQDAVLYGNLKPLDAGGRKRLIFMLSMSLRCLRAGGGVEGWSRWRLWVKMWSGRQRSGAEWSVSTVGCRPLSSSLHAGTRVASRKYQVIAPKVNACMYACVITCTPRSNQSRYNTMQCNVKGQPLKKHYILYDSQSIAHLPFILK